MCLEKREIRYYLEKLRIIAFFCGYLQDKRIHYNPYFIFFEYMMTVLDYNLLKAIFISDELFASQIR
jgi:hypothetical protein